MRNDDLSYFLRRMCEEEAAATRTHCVEAAAVHLDLASRYRAVLDATATRP